MKGNDHYMSKIVTFGEVMLRLSPTGYNRLFQNDNLQATFGGAELNVAVSLAEFGEDVVYVTKVPDNQIGDGAISNIKSFGVDTSAIVRGGSRLGIFFLEKGVNLRPSVCIYDRNNSSIQQSDVADFDWDEIFDGAKWFHFTGITPALGENLVDICLKACEKAKEKGLTISCDLNYRSKLWNQGTAAKTMKKFCPYIDLCIANEEDAQNYFGLSSENTDVYSGKLNKDGYEIIAKELVEKYGFKYMAFTLRTSISASVNKWAGMLYDGNNCYFSKEYHIDHIVDRVGGGDSFGAGLIYSMINNYGAQEAIEFAVAASALKHSIEGDFNRVTVKEINNVLQGDASGRIKR